MESFARRRTRSLNDALDAGGPAGKTATTAASGSGRRIRLSQQPMEASVFDIDGTLLESFETDSDLFVVAVRRVLGVAAVNTDWSAYPHVTDQGILREIMRSNGIAPTRALFEATRREFVALLRSHIETRGPFPEIPGARDFVADLVAREGHYVAYATGAWRESALVKLVSAGFPVEGIRLSTSSEFEDRAGIMRDAVANPPAPLTRITYYGDGVWDRLAAAGLGWDFVPVGAALGGMSRYHRCDARDGMRD